MKIRTLLCSIILVLLVGCGNPMLGNSIIPGGDTGTDTLTDTLKSEPEDPFEGVTVPEGSIAVLADDTVYVEKVLTDRYYRSVLKPNEQKVYDEIYVSANNMLGETLVSTLDTECLEKAAKAVMYDFPELFFLSNYTYIQYTVNDEIERLTFMGTYSVSESERQIYQEYIDNYYEVFTADITPEMGDYDIAKYLYDFLAFNTEYIEDSDENQNILSVMCFGKSVCTGYAKTYQYIMNHLGYETILVSGTSLKTGVPHAWLIVKLDGDYYYVDPTWGDNPTPGESTDYISPMSVNYGYLCIPDEWLSRTHKAEAFLPIPECRATADNYYIRNNVYVESSDPAEFARVVDVFDSMNLRTVTFRCSTPELLSFWREYLFDESHVFDYFNGGTSVSYKYDEDTYVITLLLN